MSTVSRRAFMGLSLSPLLGQSTVTNATSVQTGVVLDQRFVEHHISAAHPESPARYQAITEQLLAHGLLDKLQLISPIAVENKWLASVHSPQHISSIESHQPIAHQHALIATGGVLAAVDAVCSGHVSNAFCASRPPGHHAKNSGQEEGFCYYNHIAIAARYAQQRYEIDNILIIDWDYHHGNGTEWAFYADPSVLYFSTHDMFAYPGTGFPERRGEGAGVGFNINVHLGCGADDTAFTSAFTESLLPAAEQFKPDLILISAGFDSREHDVLGCHKVTDNGFKTLTAMVREIADQHCQGKIVSVLEGGYNIEGNASAAISHIKALMA